MRSWAGEAVGHCNTDSAIPFRLTRRFVLVVLHTVCGGLSSRTLLRGKLVFHNLMFGVERSDSMTCREIAHSTNFSPRVVLNTCLRSRD